MLLQTMILICDQNFQTKRKEAVVSTKMLGFFGFHQMRRKENGEWETKEREVVEEDFFILLKLVKKVFIIPGTFCSRVFVELSFSATASY